MASMKTISDHFRDWEGYVFGYGYGSGEFHVLAALQRFLECVPDRGSYDYETLERELTPPVAWLLINILCHAKIIEYGTSPRFGWLTEQGQNLREYTLSMTACELAVVADNRPEHYCECTPEICNCGLEGFSAKKLCHNPFWVERER
jgi:hypothetical protein